MEAITFGNDFHMGLLCMWQASKQKVGWGSHGHSCVIPKIRSRWHIATWYGKVLVEVMFGGNNILNYRGVDYGYNKEYRV